MTPAEKHYAARCTPIKSPAPTLVRPRPPVGAGYGGRGFIPLASGGRKRSIGAPAS